MQEHSADLRLPMAVTEESASRTSSVWFEAKWTPLYFATARGAENLHVYLWIMKDLSWSQAWYYSGYFFAITAFCWAALLSVRSIFYKAPSEIIHSVAQTIWLLGNMWWMIGELDDLRTFGTWADEYETHTQQAAWMLTAAMCLLATHYLIFRPLGLYNDRENPLVKMYNDIHPPLKPRLPVYFTDWRCYTNIHIVFWCGKDLGWMHLNSAMWLVFMIPTVLVAADFVLLSWVLGNMVWALGDNFFAEDATERQDMWHEPYHWKTMRWWASWAFLMAFVPFAILYMVWIPCSLLNKHIAPSDHKDGKALSVTTDAEAAS